MKPIALAELDEALQRFVGHTVFIHLETTNGAYSQNSLGSSIAEARGAFMRNIPVRFHRAAAAGTGPYRVGLKTEQGWIYAEGLTDWTVDAEGRLLIAGHDAEGRLAVALELSLVPFEME